MLIVRESISIPRGFRTGFAIAFSIHAFITLTLSIGTWIARSHGMTACSVCEDFNAMWNSIGFFAASVAGVLMCPHELTSQTVHLFSKVIDWTLSYLLTPFLFGLWLGYVFKDAEKIVQRFLMIFLVVYAPLWVITFSYILQWYVSGFIAVNQCPTFSSLFQ